VFWIFAMPENERPRAFDSLADAMLELKRRTTAEPAPAPPDDPFMALLQQAADDGLVDAIARYAAVNGRPEAARILRCMADSLDGTAAANFPDIQGNA
jgi:hypothetical protein